MLSIESSLNEEAKRIVEIKNALQLMIDGSTENFQMSNTENEFTVIFNYPNVGKTELNFSLQDVYYNVTGMSHLIYDDVENFIIKEYRRCVFNSTK